MAICPDCGHENLDGTDVCEQCQNPLSSLSNPRPASKAERNAMRDRVQQLVPREPLVVLPDTPVGEVLRRMVDRAVGSAVVVANHEVVGIFTERDVLVQLGAEATALSDRPVADFMTRSVETLDLQDRIAFALHKMDLGGYRHIPILTKGRVTGIISVRDILNYITATLNKKG
jgi:CBS domain-containing protein